MMSIPPNQTLHFGNLNSKIKKLEIRSSLYSLCVTYGRVLDIVVPESKNMRGQAFVVFWDVSSAAVARRQLEGFNFYDRPLAVNFALSKSDSVSKIDGTFQGVVNIRRERLSAKERLKRLSMIANTDSTQEIEKEIEKRKDEKRKDREQTSDDEQTVKKPKTEAERNSEADPEAEAESEEEEAEMENNVLFLENLPFEMTTEMLSALFEQYPGFKEVRRIPGKPDLAFVDYETTKYAAEAREVLNGFRITPEKALRISFARR
ncbi:U2 small nuclear ribonucleoprotein B'' [Zancudomyces culisetae]|uniref:U2 small nuclear ribonucleoprotein B n=1 Tax=Zancudomyces culisetae TaxID=1213189 RepID=A0A1R1PZD5_ZANCU|nr:U2 small nuclear ribonucleoprotein B'' [Zancudomyces culisetae]|eukprot:OMH86305.1 U2 small nuclear ribonucleoprotein B'' [Zancudomyces culisetae]